MENVTNRIVLSNPKYLLIILAYQDLRTVTLMRNGLKLRTIAKLDPNKSDSELIKEAEGIIKVQAL